MREEVKVTRQIGLVGDKKQKSAGYYLGVLHQGLDQDQASPAHFASEKATVAQVVDSQPFTVEQTGTQVVASTARTGYTTHGS